MYNFLDYKFQKDRKTDSTILVVVAYLYFEPTLGFFRFRNSSLIHIDFTKTIITDPIESKIISNNCVLFWRHNKIKIPKKKSN